MHLSLHDFRVVNACHASDICRPSSYKMFLTSLRKFSCDVTSRTKPTRAYSRYFAAQKVSHDLDQKPGHPKDTLKVIGVGQRSASIAAKFVQGGSFSSEQIWHVDLEARANEFPEIQQKLLLANDKAYRWTEGHDLSSLVGADANLRHNRVKQTSKHALVLAAAGCVPGGPESVLCIVDALKAAGTFTAVAITLPFNFEGARRLDSARSLVQSLQNVADLVCIVHQNALMEVTTNADGSPMTVADATSIADSAQESLVKLVSSSLSSDDVLLADPGRMVWLKQSMLGLHGPTFDEMRAWLRQGSRCSLGRGAAGLPAEFAQTALIGQSLVKLTRNAVISAAESPFLEGMVKQADCAWCSIKLPRINPRGQHGSMAWQMAVKEACQAAASVLQSMTACSAAYIFYTISQEADPKNLSVEASLLLSTSQEGPTQGSEQPRHVLSEPLLGHRQSQSHNASRQHKQAGDIEQGSRQPQRNWQALSAMAGGALHARQAATCPDGIDQEASPQTAANRVKPATNGELGDLLAERLIAQSLDLPPKAAKWRQQQRAKSQPPKMMVNPPEAAYNKEDDTTETLTSGMKAILGGESNRMDVRQRMFAIIERDRDDLH